MDLLLLAHVGATLFMVGLIWFVQVVHYPLFGSVGEDRFVGYAEAHSRLTSLVVGPPMLLEAATTTVLLFVRPAAIPATAAWAGFVLLAAIWVSTALLQVPRHTALGEGFNAASHRFLLASNWIRTVCWSARGLLVLWMVSRVMG
ncbi:MAG: hypothetical protein WA990_15670 [Rubrobacteraceae bacterium]